MVEVTHRKTLDEAEGAVVSADWSPTGEWLAVGSSDSNVYIYDRNFENVAVLNQASGPVREVEWHPGEDLIAVIEERGGGGKLWLISSADWSTVKSFSQSYSKFDQGCGLTGGCGVRFQSGSFTPDGNSYWVGSTMKFLQTPNRWIEFLIRYDLSSPDSGQWGRAEVQRVGGAPRDYGSGVGDKGTPGIQVTSDGTVIYIDDQRKAVVKGEKRLAAVPKAQSLKLTKNEKWLAVAGSDKTYIYNTETVQLNDTAIPPWSLVHEVPPLNDGVESLAFGFKNQFLALGNGNSPFELEIWRSKLNSATETWERIATEVRGHGNAINDIAWSREGAFLVTASSDDTTRVWSTPFATPPCTVNRVLKDNLQLTAPEPVGSLDCVTAGTLAAAGVGGLGLLLATQA